MIPTYRDDKLAVRNANLTLTKICKKLRIQFYKSDCETLQTLCVCVCVCVWWEDRKCTIKSTLTGIFTKD